MPGIVIVMLKLSDNDRNQIRALLRSAAISKNMVTQRELLDVLVSPQAAFQAMLKGVQEKNNTVRLHSSHIVVYDILMEGDFPMEHLSISHSKKVTDEDVLIIAKEFGLGDRSTWTMYMPPRPPMRAFHIMRTLGA